MIQIAVPGYRTLQLGHLVLDYNGTLAVDGEPLPGVGKALRQLAQKLEIHVVTADTFGKVRSRLADGPWRIVLLPAEDQAEGKRQFVRRLGAEQTAAVGNGRNDRWMLQEAALGVAVVQAEGAAWETLCQADVVCPNALAALELLLHPLRLVATLRS